MENQDISIILKDTLAVSWVALDTIRDIKLNYISNDLVLIVTNSSDDGFVCKFFCICSHTIPKQRCLVA